MSLYNFDLKTKRWSLCRILWSTGSDNVNIHMHVNAMRDLLVSLKKILLCLP